MATGLSKSKGNGTFMSTNIIDINTNSMNKVFLNKIFWLECRDSIKPNMRLTGYPTEKNVDMLETIILTFSNPNDIIMDCFCGSGSTLQAAFQNERQWIRIDNSIEAISTTLRRFHMGVEAMGDYVNPVDIQQDDANLLNPDFFTPTLFEKCSIILEIQKEFLEMAKNIWL